MRVLVTAGPTREHWDDVRFLSSAATGRLGIALASALAGRGHACDLVLGPTHLAAARGADIAVHDVVSARDMLAACESVWPECDALVATAAVADYRPAERHAGKRRKGGGPLTLPLECNPDVLATLSAGRGRRPAIGFALQVEDGEQHARRKLAEKDLDAIVLDGPEAMGDGPAEYRILRRDGAETRLPRATKDELAARIVHLLEELDEITRA